MLIIIMCIHCRIYWFNKNMGNFPTPLFFSGSACTVESREESVVEEFSESEFDDDVDDDVEGESIN